MYLFAHIWHTFGHLLNLIYCLIFCMWTISATYLSMYVQIYAINFGEKQTTLALFSLSSLAVAKHFLKSVARCRQASKTGVNQGSRSREVYWHTPTLGCSNLDTERRFRSSLVPRNLSFVSKWYSHSCVMFYGSCAWSVISDIYSLNARNISICINLRNTIARKCIRCIHVRVLPSDTHVCSAYTLVVQQHKQWVHSLLNLIQN